MDKPDKLVTQAHNTKTNGTQYVLDTTMHKQTQTT